MSDATPNPDAEAADSGSRPAKDGRASSRSRASRIARQASSLAGRLPPARGVLWIEGEVGARLAVAALALEWTRRGLVSLRFLRRRAADAAMRDANETVPVDLGGLLLDYFAGLPVEPTDLPVDVSGTSFQRRVWSALRAIPRGQVRSYADVARSVGSPLAVRAVGSANAANPVPLVVPCHRVINKGGALGGYSGGGPERKRRLLVLEGLSVRAGHVDSTQLPLPRL